MHSAVFIVHGKAGTRHSHSKHLASNPFAGGSCLLWGRYASVALRRLTMSVTFSSLASLECNHCWIALRRNGLSLSRLPSATRFTSVYRVRLQSKPLCPLQEESTGMVCAESDIFILSLAMRRVHLVFAECIVGCDFRDCW